MLGRIYFIYSWILVLLCLGVNFLLWMAGPELRLLMFPPLFPFPNLVLKLFLTRFGCILVEVGQALISMDWGERRACRPLGHPLFGGRIMSWKGHS